MSDSNKAEGCVYSLLLIACLVLFFWGIYASIHGEEITADQYLVLKKLSLEDPATGTKVDEAMKDGFVSRWEYDDIQAFFADKTRRDARASLKGD